MKNKLTILVMLIALILSGSLAFGSSKNCRTDARKQYKVETTKCNAKTDENAKTSCLDEARKAYKAALKKCSKPKIQEGC